ncbi:MAG: dihydrofolate reductase family protein, partial [Thermoplasmata archaeon]|nr:dihydrofolate reductase family protein [Thermoplasmata archaeon]
LAFMETVWGNDLESYSIEQNKTVGLLLFGRITYAGMASFWSTQTGEIADFMNRVPKVVFSRSLKQVDWSNARLEPGRPEEVVARLKREAGKDILFGSVDLTTTLMDHGLVDELRLGLTPIVLGGGRPLFKPSPNPRRMKLLDAQSLPGGLVILRYEPSRDG